MGRWPVKAGYPGAWQRRPSSFYQLSARRSPDTLTGWTYPADNHGPRVNAHGYVAWQDPKP
jgi:hypothetical protein